jgi:hypothetical protein
MDLETGHPWDLLTRSYLLASTPKVLEELMQLLTETKSLPSRLPLS